MIHSYRHRNFNAPGEPRFVEIEQQLAKRPPIAVPTIVLHGGDDAFGAPAAEITAGERATLPEARRQAHRRRRRSLRAAREAGAGRPGDHRRHQTELIDAVPLNSATR